LLNLVICFLFLVVAGDPSFFNNNQQAGLGRLFLGLRLGCVAGWLQRFLQAEKALLVC